MEKNNDLFECKPGECNLTKVADQINFDLSEHLKEKLSTIRETYPEVHRGCITKIFAEQLIESGHLLMGELIEHNFKKAEQDDS